MSPGQVQPEIIERHLAALRGALRELRRHQGASVRSLRTDTSRRWAVPASNSDPNLARRPGNRSFERRHVDSGRERHHRPAGDLQAGPTLRLGHRPTGLAVERDQPQPTTPPSTVKLWPVVQEPARDAR